MSGLRRISANFAGAWIVASPALFVGMGDGSFHSDYSTSGQPFVLFHCQLSSSQHGKIVICPLRFRAVFHIASWFSWGISKQPYNLAAWKQGLPALRPHDQQHATGKVFCHWSSQRPHQDAISVWIILRRMDPLLPYLTCEHWAKFVPPIAYCFVANFDAAFMKQIFNVAKWKWKPDVHHHRKADDLGRCLEIAEWIMIFHSEILSNCWDTVKVQFSSESAIICLRMS